MSNTDISNISHSNTIGFDNRGGLSSNADGDHNLCNDNGTNNFRIDVNGSADLIVADDMVSLNGGATAQEFRVYNEDNGSGDAAWFSVAFSDNDVEISHESSGTGDADRTIFNSPGMFQFIVNGQTELNIQAGIINTNAIIRPVTTNTDVIGQEGFRYKDIKTTNLDTDSDNNTVEIKNGLNSQALRTYSDTTTDAERCVEIHGDGYIDCYGTNNLTFRSTSAGLNSTPSIRFRTGTDGITVSNSVKPNNNNVGDIGESSKTFRNLYLGGSVVSMTGLPTSDPSVAGQLWNDSGTLKVSAG